jgi:hypothetical protein
MRINGTRIMSMIRQSFSEASLELYPKTRSPSCGRVASLCEVIPSACRPKTSRR